MVTSTTSSVITRTMKCPTCGHDTNLCNYVLNFTDMTSTVVCAKCRDPLKEKTDG